MSYEKHFAKTQMLKLLFHPSNFRTYFPQKIVCQLLWSPLVCTNLPFAVYKFTCAGRQSCYIGENKRHLPTRIKEHQQTDTKSHILQRLNENLNCRYLCDDSCFIIIDHASSSLRLKLKEALHITWLKPILNKRMNDVSIIISV